MAGTQYIKWSGHLETGEPVIDDGHKLLIDTLNELFTACFVGQGASHLQTILDKLLNNIQTHFAEEEAFLEATGQHLTEHKNEHRRFLETIRDFRQSSQRTDDVSHEALGFLHDWIVDHLKSESRDLAVLAAVRANRQ